MAIAAKMASKHNVYLAGITSLRFKVEHELQAYSDDYARAPACISPTYCRTRFGTATVKPRQNPENRHGPKENWVQQKQARVITTVPASFVLSLESHAVFEYL